MPKLVHVSVYDPSRAVPNGTLLLDQLNAEKVARKGCLLLPVDDDLVPQMSGKAMGGFVIREWGKDGWLYQRRSGERGCPMLIQAVPERTWLYWAAQVVSPTGSRPDTLRLSGDPAQGSGFFAAGASPVGVETWSELGHFSRGSNAKSWMLEGRCRLSVTENGIFAFCLYGVAKDARVIWSAASIASV